MVLVLAHRFSSICPSDSTFDLERRVVRLFEMKTDGSFRERSLDRQVRADNKSFKLKVTDGILEQNAQHVLVITDALKTADGKSIEAMTAGILAMADAPVVEDEKSTIASLDLESAQKLELVRGRRPLLSKVCGSGYGGERQYSRCVELQDSRFKGAHDANA